MLRLLSLACLAAVALALPLAAQPAPDRQPEAPLPHTLTLTGVGEARATPDVAVVHIGVVSQAATARQALDDNSRTMTALLSALREQGFAEKDLQTSSFAVNPRYDYRQDQSPPRIVGYDVSNQLAVTVRDLDKLGAVLDRAVSLGSNQIFGIAFALDKPEPLRDEARRLAVRDAMRKSRLYAEEAGVELGPILSISEQAEVQPPQPVFQEMRMAADAAATVPIAKGEHSVEVRVTMSWRIE